MNADRTTETRGSVTFTLVEQRGTTRIMVAVGNEPLPYAVFVADPRDLIARCEDRVTATWILDGLEGEQK